MLTRPTVRPMVRSMVGSLVPSQAAFSPAVRDYFARLDAAGLRVRAYDAANAALIDRLVGNGGNFWPDSGAFNAMAGYLYPTGGTLIPLHPNHDAGTLNAFVSGDWNAATGLKGDGSTKYVNSNRKNNADGQNDQAAGIYVTTATTTTSGAYIGDTLESTSGRFNIGVSTTSLFTRNRSGTARVEAASSIASIGLISTSRDNGTDYLFRFNGGNVTQTVASESPSALDLIIFGRRQLNGTTIAGEINARLPYYHIGPNLSGAGELAELDAALTAWQAALASA